MTGQNARHRMRKGQKTRLAMYSLAGALSIVLAVWFGYWVTLPPDRQSVDQPEAPDLAAPGAKLPALSAVPLPNLRKLDQVVQHQLEDCQAMLTAMEKKPNATPAELSDAFGEMGKLYHAYELLEAAEACYRNAQTLASKEFPWPYYLGHLYRTQGKLPEATVALERALAIRPEDLPAMVALAETNLLLNQAERAGNLFRKILAKYPSCASAMVGLGKIASSDRDFPAAVACFQSALKLSPNATAIHYSLAMAYRGLGDMTKAREHLQLRGDVAPTLNDPLMANLRNLPTGARHHEKRGVSTGKAGQLDRALKELQKAVQANPLSPSARVNLGVALTKLGDSQPAIVQFREAIRLKPNFAIAHLNLGILLRDQGDAEQAVKHLRQAIRIDPQYLNAHLALADILLKNATYQDAANHYSHVIRIDPRHRAARLAQAMALAQMGKYAEAHARLKQGRELLPESMILAHAHARLLAAAPDQNLRDGATALKLALEVFKVRQSVDHAETVAMAYAETAQYDQAVTWQKRAILAAGKSPPYEPLSRLQKNLALYQKRQPCREPWPK